MSYIQIYISVYICVSVYVLYPLWLCNIFLFSDILNTFHSSIAIFGKVSVIKFVAIPLITKITN